MMHDVHDAYHGPARNGLAIAGFTCSLVGLVLTAGILSPIGLILSLVALGREPRGFAIAGVVLGVIGTCGGVVILVLFGTAILAALGITLMALSLSEPEKTELTNDMAHIAVAVKEYEQQHGRLPEELAEVALPPSRLQDPWGHSYDYTRLEKKPGFDVISPGADGKPDTSDDVRLTGMGKRWQAAGSDVSVKGGRSGGRVHLKIGGRVIDIAGSEKGGRITLDLGGDRVVEIEGGHSGD